MNVSRYNDLGIDNSIDVTGMMSSGKTTVSKALAEELGIPFFDSDAIVKRRLGGLTIPDYITQKDNDEVPYTNFRNRESEGLDEHAELHKNQPHVLATWWGTHEAPQFHRNQAILDKRKYVGVYTNTDVEQILEWKNKDVKGNENRSILDEAEFRKRYIDRDPWYRMASWIIVPNNGSINETVEQIIDELPFACKLKKLRLEIDEVDNQLIDIIKKYGETIGSLHDLRDFPKWEGLLDMRESLVKKVGVLKNQYDKNCRDESRQEFVRIKWVNGLGEIWGVIYNELHEDAVDIEEQCN